MATLSKRETELVDDLIKGLPSKQIADKNFVSIHTVHTHFKRVKKKLDAKNNVDVAIKYLQSLEDPTAYLRKLTLSVFFIGLYAVLMLNSPDADLRRPLNASRSARTHRRKIS